MSAPIHNAFHRAPRRFEPLPLTPPHDCEEDGHAWQFIRSESDGFDEISLYRCRECGEEDLQ